MAIRAYLCTVLGIPNSEMATLPYGDNTSVSLLLVDGERTTVEYYNDNRHLPPALSTFGRQTWWRGSGSGAENLRYEPLRFPRDEAFYLQCYRDAWRNAPGVVDSTAAFPDVERMETVWRWSDFVAQTCLRNPPLLAGP